MIISQPVLRDIMSRLSDVTERTCNSFWRDSQVEATPRGTLAGLNPLLASVRNGSEADVPANEDKFLGEKNRHAMPRKTERGYVRAIIPALDLNL